MGQSKVLTEIETRSDHFYVIHAIGTPTMTTTIPPFKWSPRSLDIKKMKEIYDERVATLDVTQTWGEREVWEYLAIVQDVCEGSVNKTKPSRRPKTVGEIGWNAETKALRKEANRLRRRKQRAYRKAPEVLEACAAEYKEACKRLSIGLLRARVDAWHELCAGLDEDIWGRPYKIIMAKLKARTPRQTSQEE